MSSGGRASACSTRRSAPTAHWSHRSAARQYTNPEVRELWSAFMQTVDRSHHRGHRGPAGPRRGSGQPARGRAVDVAEPAQRGRDDGVVRGPAACAARRSRARQPGPHLDERDLRRHALICRTSNANICSCPGPGASILHADLDSFYASVEQRDDPTLRGRPVIVGGGVVLAASYEAKAYGVRTAMGGRQARAAVPARHRRPAADVGLLEASDAVFEVFHDTTPLVEPLSVDEAFLDVSGLRRVSGTPVQIGARLRAQVRDGSACPSPSASRAPSSWPRSPARRPSPTACCWCRRTANWPSCTRCRCGGCGASARRPPTSCTRTASRRSPTSPSSASRCSGRWSAERWAGSCSRCPATSIAAGW